MEKYYFLEEDIYDYINDTTLIGQGTESRTYFLDGRVAKILLPEFCHFYLKRKLRKIEEMNLGDIITSPVGELYCDYKYIGFLMEYAGSNLVDYLEKNKLSLDQRISILKRVKEELIEFHNHGLVHGDIQFCNILIDDNLNPKISDINNIRFGRYHDMYMNSITYPLSFKLGQSYLLDVIAFNYLTYIFINYYDKDISGLLSRGADGAAAFRYYSDDNKMFDKDITREQMNILKEPRLGKKYALSNTKYLIDYLK